MKKNIRLVPRQHGETGRRRVCVCVCVCCMLCGSRTNDEHTLCLNFGPPSTFRATFRNVREYCEEKHPLSTEVTCTHTNKCIQPRNHTQYAQTVANLSPPYMYFLYISFLPPAFRLPPLIVPPPPPHTPTHPPAPPPAPPSIVACFSVPAGTSVKTSETR